MIESSCMMLDYISENKIAAKIRKTIAKLILEGKIKTYDMKKMAGQQDVIEKGASSTEQMANAIIAKLE